VPAGRQLVAEAGGARPGNITMRMVILK
jgi:hypothetical protein